MTSSREWPTRRTCTTRIRLGARPGNYSRPPCLASCSDFSCWSATPDLSKVHVYERLALYFLGSIGTFYALDALLPITTAMVIALYGVDRHQHLLLVRQCDPGELIPYHHRNGHPLGALADSGPGTAAAVSSGWRAPRLSSASIEQESGARPQPIQLSVKGSKALRVNDQEKGRRSATSRSAFTPTTSR